MLRYWTAGESHGKALLALVDGFPAGVEIRSEAIDRELRRRQGGYGRGGRQRIETDAVDILSGVWQGVDRQPDRPAGGQQRLQARAARETSPGRGPATAT
jgi:chorismate synthase